MASIEDIRRMRQEGRTDEQIRTSLKQQGISDAQIGNMMSQSDIKAAVGGRQDVQQVFQQGSSEIVGGVPEQSYGQAVTSEYTAQPQQGYNGSEASGYAPSGSQYEGMQPSMINQQEGYSQQSADSQIYAQTPQEGYGSQEGYPSMGGYPSYGGQYQPYQETLSSDIITEISEQVVSEKLSQLRDRFEKAVDFRTVAEARISNLDDRLKRIEKILDRLQLSILQKVGEYVGDVKDLKKDLEETQKSFKALSDKKKC